MYISVILLPVFSAFIAGFFGKFIGKRGTVLITLTFLGLSALLSLFIFYEVALCKSIVCFKCFTWISSGSLFVEWGFLFDSITAVMLVIVTFISFLVHVYSVDYMHNDPNFTRFMSYLSLFTSFMLILVTADNFLQMFLGWEGVGLASYLLINFWHTRINANKAAIKAIIVNRIGDFGVTMAIILLAINCYSVDYYVIFAIIGEYVQANIYFCGLYIDLIDLICFFLFLGAIGKSAQIGLHTWLPDAMEGPTPVSALIHAATMVTAGVFLIIRCSPIFQYSPNVLVLMTIIGALTAFLAATIGAFQNDLKKVIAYSTCSQLGYMIFGCGLSSYNISLFHLSNHAFFKALLFLSAGAVIHALNDEQDMRRMGGLVKIMPFTYSMFLIGSLALMGFPFLSGYYSKDLLLEVAFGSFTMSGHFAYWLGVMAAFFTSFYSFRLLYLTFYTKPNSYRVIFKNVHEVSYWMAIPLGCLCLGSIFIGYLTRDMMVGLGTNFWNGAIHTSVVTATILIDSECLPIKIKLLPTVVSLSGALLAFIVNKYFRGYSIYLQKKNSKLVTVFRYYYNVINKKWLFDNIYNRSIVIGFLDFGYYVTFKIIDRGLIECLGPLGIIRALKFLSNKILTLQSGYLYHYTLSFLLGILSIVGFIIVQSYSGFLSEDSIFIIVVTLLYFILDDKK